MVGWYIFGSKKQQKVEMDGLKRQKVENSKYKNIFGIQRGF